MASDDIRVAVRSADPLTRAGALSFLRHEPGLELVEPPVAPGRDLVVVVLAHRLDEATVTDLRTLTRTPGRRVVLVADRLREPELMTVLECDVRAILWRAEVTRSRLVEAIRAATRGESRLPPDLVGHLIAHVGRVRWATAHTPPVALPVGLAPRELDVLKLLADGLDTREIAEKLAYSERTIKNVLSRLTTRLQLRNRAHAVAFALREGYI